MRSDLCAQLHPPARVLAPGIWRSPLLICGMASSKKHRWTHQHSWNLPMMNMACVALLLPAKPPKPSPSPGEASPGEWFGSLGLRAWLLCLVRLNAGRLCLVCQSPVVPLAPARRTLGRDCFRQASAALHAAVIACSHPRVALSHSRLVLPSKSRYIFRLRQILKDHLRLFQTNAAPTNHAAS